LNRAIGISEIEGKAARVAASEPGDERVSIRGWTEESRH